MLIEQTIVRFIENKSGITSVNLSDCILSKIKSFDFMLLMIELEQKLQLPIPFEQALASNVVEIGEFIQWVEQQYASVNV